MFRVKKKDIFEYLTADLILQRFQLPHLDPHALLFLLLPLYLDLCHAQVALVSYVFSVILIYGLSFPSQGRGKRYLH
jgi:hypothetical protein